eukprot:g29129.t1
MRMSSSMTCSSLFFAFKVIAVVFGQTSSWTISSLVHTRASGHTSSICPLWAVTIWSPSSGAGWLTDWASQLALGARVSRFVCALWAQTPDTTQSDNVSTFTVATSFTHTDSAVSNENPSI